ncbi:MAG TPA: MoxR family ATPase [bacterium]|nr:MoxR family ATPase [bacterium]
METSENFEFFTDRIKKIKDETGKVIIGQNEAIDKSLVVILTGSHALVEGVPGVGKTLLVKTLAKVLGSEFSRIQFTPDLMPADITGANVFNMKENEFVFVKGPVFTGFLLADEINRAPAKTQSALLQAMQEKEVTIDCQTFSLSKHFTVFATQNPIEFEGTYPLPEAQKDRFMLKINAVFPNRDDEIILAKRTLGADAPENFLNSGKVYRVIEQSELTILQETINSVFMKEELVNYIVDIIRETRNNENILIGAGPRAMQSLILASRAFAAINGRNFATPDDIKFMAVPVLEHRLIQRPEYEIEGYSIIEIINAILKNIPVPR